MLHQTSTTKYLVFSSMDVQLILRWLVTAIVIVVAVVLLGFVLQIATVLLKLAIKFLVVLMIIALAVRLLDVFKSR